MLEVATTSRGPFQLTVLQVCGWEREQHKKEKSRLLLPKNYTEVKLKEGNTRSLEQQEVMRLQQTFQINAGGQKEKTPTQNPKSTNRVRYGIESYARKLSVKVTPSPKLSYCSYLKYLLSLTVPKVSKKSPSSSRIQMWSQLHTNGGSPAKHQGCLSVSGSLCPAHSTYAAVPHFSVMHIVQVLW